MTELHLSSVWKEATGHLEKGNLKGHVITGQGFKMKESRFG